MENEVQGVEGLVGLWRGIGVTVQRYMTVVEEFIPGVVAGDDEAWVGFVDGLDKVIGALVSMRTGVVRVRALLDKATDARLQ